MDSPSNLKLQDRQQFVKLFWSPYFSTDIKNVIRSQDDVGRKTIQFDIQEKVALFGFYEILLSFPVTTKEVKENAIIQNTANVMGGIIQVKQRYLLSDYENGTLLEHYPSFTAPQILARVSKGVALAAHADLLHKIRQHFEDLSTTQKWHRAIRLNSIWHFFSKLHFQNHQYYLPV